PEGQSAGPKLNRAQRRPDEHGGPESDAQRAPNLPRLTCPDRLRGERRDGRHKAKSEHEGRVENSMRQGGRRDGAIAQPTDQGDIDGQHRDLAELRERERAREPDRLAQSVSPYPTERGALVGGL